MEFDLPKENSSIIKVIGVGGGGGNAVKHMYKEQIKGIDFIVCNTDKQALDDSPVPHKILLGKSLTAGRGAGSIPDVGRCAAEENRDEIHAILEKNTSMVFITAGMGGGTGTGAAPIIAEIAKNMGILTVGIVTVPFNFEGIRRRRQAEDGLEELRKHVDALLIISNERLRETTSNMTISSAFAEADNILTVAAKGITTVITSTGIVNRDLNDVNTIMRNSGVAIMGSAAAEGENRALKAVQNALSSPLLNDNDIKGATHVLLYITFGQEELSMDEMSEITSYIEAEAGSQAETLFGLGHDPSLEAQLNVTVIATGFESSPITGFEKDVEQQRIILDDEPKVEIKKTIKSPMETSSKTQTNRMNNSTVQYTPLKNMGQGGNSTIPEPEMTKFDWEITKINSEPAQQTQTNNVIQRVMLDSDEDEERVQHKDFYEQESKRSTESQAKKQQERMMRLQELTSKLKNAEGIIEFEQEPAYTRRKVPINNELNFAPDDPQESRFSVEEDEFGHVRIKTNNTFLHDNVD